MNGQQNNQQGVEVVDGYEVPVDPMDDLECDSCQ
jgi:hypothetical protein